jgi:nicotinamide phosphoribosyltransferase
MYPKGTTMIYSNFTPRKSRLKGVNSVIFFGLQHFILKYLIGKFQKEFFDVSFEKVKEHYSFAVNVNTDHIEKLWKLGYLPIEIKAVEEGSVVPIGTPCFTIKNTHPDFYWLTNYLETLISCQMWQPITSATIAYQYKKLLSKYSLETTGSTDFVQWQGHDFSMRGMSSVESAILSGMGHLTSFTGTDTIPAIYALKSSYNTQKDELIGASVPATEHSVMCMGSKDGEIETFERLLDLYPTGILSVVSDTWDLWKVCTEFLPKLKDKVLARDGKLVIRPDSGDPVDIICGKNIKIAYLKRKFEKESCSDDRIEELRNLYKLKQDEFLKYTTEDYYTQLNDGWYWLDKNNQHWFGNNNENPEIFVYEDKYFVFGENGYRKQILSDLETISSNEFKGVIELLWDTFGGTTNEQGFKVLDPHIGAIYGDSITLDRAGEICKKLKAKGFASTNIVLGIGSYTYQYNTRDTFGFAMKATYGEIEGKGQEIFKDPITDDGTKKSAKGLLQVYQDDQGCSNPIGDLKLKDQCTWKEEQQGLLKTVFIDGKLIKETTLQEIRNKLKIEEEVKA